MPKPLIADNKYYCPYCHIELKASSVKYNKIVRGVFKGDTVIKETIWECPECGYSYWIKETE